MVLAKQTIILNKNKNKKMESSRSFKKIAIKEKVTKVHYYKHILDGEEVKNIKYPIESDVTPHIDFVTAFQALKKYAIGYMELSPFKNGVDDSILEKHIVTALNITEDTETVKIQISMNKYLTNGKCYSITSPLIDLENEDFPEIKELSDIYDLVIDEATLYLKGKNGEEQMEINFEAA